MQLSNKAEALRGLKEFPNSFVLHMEVLNKRILLLGSTHFDVAESYAGIGFLLREQGEIEESNKYLKESLLILKDISNRIVLTIYEPLVKNYYELKDFSNYLKSLKEKLNLEEILFGPNSLNTLRTLYDIIDADGSQFLLIDKLIEIYKVNNVIIDDQHLVKLLNYVKKIIKAGKKNEAMSLLIKINDNLIINNTIAEAEVLFLVAKCNELDNNFAKAELNLKRALKIYDFLRPSDHFDIGATHYELGEVYANLKDFKKVKKHFKIALPILEKYKETQLHSNNIRQVLRILR